MSSAQTHSFDFIVLGSGVAGLTYALKVATRGRVAIITKTNRADSNTNWAQGGIASVTSREDSFELHVQDTLEAGAGLCRESAVRTIVEEGPERIAELMRIGAQFSERDIPGGGGRRELDLTKEGGHSKRRILHAADATGREIERALLAAVAANPAITVFREPSGDRPHHHGQTGDAGTESLCWGLCVEQPGRTGGCFRVSHGAARDRGMR